MNPEVAIIILHWNNLPDTLACIRSVKELDYAPYRIVVVDNGSADDSNAAIAAQHPDVTLLRTADNLGYVGGNNLGIQYALNAGYDYMWLLNDDVTVDPQSLTALMNVAQAKPNSAFLGPKVYCREDPHRFLSAGCLLVDGWQPQHRGIGEIDEGQFDDNSEVDYLSGCALLVSRKAVDTIGLLDTDFFAYHEDTEWCFRGKRAGFSVLYVPKAAVWHPDTRSRDVDSPLVTYYISRNYLLFLTKWRFGAILRIRTFILYLVRVMNWSIRPKWRHKAPQRNALMRALIDFSLGRFGRATGLN